MTKISFASLFSLFFFFSTICNAELVSGRILNFTDGRQIILLGDHYSKSSQHDNFTAAFVAMAIKNIATKFPESKIDFSYQDPGFYGAGRNRENAGLDFVRSLIPQTPQNHVPVLFRVLAEVPPSKLLERTLSSSKVQPSAEAEFFALCLEKPEKLSSFVVGDLTLQLARVANEAWPKNLVIRSNDPRGILRRNFITDSDWLKVVGSHVPVKDLIMASQILHAKLKTPLAKTLEESRRKVLKELFKDFEDRDRLYAEEFASFASVQTDSDISVETLNQTVGALKDTIPIDLVLRFLEQQVKESDPHENAPIIDLMATFFTKHHPDRMIAIIDQNLVEKFGLTLSRIGVVIDSEVVIENVNLFIGEMARSADHLDTYKIIWQ